MRTLRHTLLATCLAVLMPAPAADAGDILFPQPPAVQVPEPMPIPDYSGGWYFRGDIAWSHHDDPDLGVAGTGFSSSEMDETWGFGAGFGHNFSDSVRGDVTVDYRLESGVSGISDAGNRHGSDLSSTVVLANAYYDIYGRSGFAPYIGGGLGFSYNETDEYAINNVFFMGEQDKTDLAAAAMAGVSYRLDSGLMFDAGYRFLYLGDAETTKNGAGARMDIGDIQAHEVRFGLRYEFH